MATIKASKVPPLEVIVWANIKKWQMIRNASDEEIAAVLGVQSLWHRERKKRLTVDEMERLCAYLAIEPERLLER